MLSKLIIKNVALIERVDIDFKENLNVLSGETGSGKSVIIESLNFVLGAKADKTLIRNGETECFVRAEFEVDNNPLIKEVYDELDFEEDNLLIVTRKFDLNGKNEIKVNGNSCTVGMLKKFTACLVDVHGQSEHFYLLKTSNQRALLDDFGGNDTANIKREIAEKYAEYSLIIKKITALGGDENTRAQRLDVLNYQIDEIEGLALKEGEEEELSVLRQKIINQEKIFSAVSIAKSALEDEGGAYDSISNAEKSFSSISSLDDEYSSLFDRLSALREEADDISSELSNIVDGFDNDFDADYVENRLEEIKKAKRKYGNSFEEINNFLDAAKLEKAQLEDFTETNQKLLVEKADIQKDLYENYIKLSELRQKSAKTLTENVIKELKELGMKDAQFTVVFSKKPDINDCDFNGENGFDSVEFMFSANLGEPVKPLSLVISGGEISRFMLAIKAQTSKFNSVSTFVFDEIDTGISGEIAKVVAEKFAKISVYTQIIAITHLPQISAMADNNILIYKSQTDKNTFTNVKLLDQKEKILEIIRLSGGDENSVNSYRHAEELIDRANKYKKDLKKSV